MTMETETVDMTAKEAFDAGRAATVAGYSSLPEFVRAAVRLAVDKTLGEADKEAKAGEQ